MSEAAGLCSIFIFLCLSLHACNARNFRIDDDKGLVVVVYMVQVKMDFSEDKGTSNIWRSEDEDPAAATQELDEESDIPNEEMKNVKEDKESSAGVAPVKPDPVVNSVSWRVPQKSSSHSEHPGFNSDYSQPRTRTPCHN
ncbi:hypothetical protein HS088_TW08G00181 [Tripterygium wilfordii]|uniref:Uncharacterized protein n=1 Tax=Tripterygium wilfordii TaxID=458696 RepID=A0A7J7DC03_TRIWF|nr:hypothetical protein HS088_TW08G00181 [Tripterygium wilfordii]